MPQTGISARKGTCERRIMFGSKDTQERKERGSWERWCLRKVKKEKARGDSG